MESWMKHYLWAILIHRLLCLVCLGLQQKKRGKLIWDMLCLHVLSNLFLLHGKLHGKFWESVSIESQATALSSANFQSLL